MSHELPDSFSVLMLNSMRQDAHGSSSNFQWGHSQQTIPRHLRDVVVSEYGIAFLKNRSDEQVIQALLSIADRSAQENLRKTAIANAKLSSHWRLPEWCANNDAGFASGFLQEFKAQGLFPSFPFGSDFTPVEEKLAIALNGLKRASLSRYKLAALFWRGLRSDRTPHSEALERMQLADPQNWRERIYQILLLGAF